MASENYLMHGYTDDSDADVDNANVMDLAEIVYDDLFDIVDSQNYDDFKMTYDDISDNLLNRSFDYTFYDFSLDKHLENVLDDLNDIYRDLKVHHTGYYHKQDKQDLSNDMKDIQGYIDSYKEDRDPNDLLDL